MGMDINVYRVDFARLSQVPGSRNEQLLQQLVDFYELDDEAESGDDDDEYEPGEEPLPLQEALRHIFFGTIPDTTPDPAYSGAMALIYPAVGAHIGDLRVAAWGIEPSFVTRTQS